VTVSADLDSEATAPRLEDAGDGGAAGATPAGVRKRRSRTIPLLLALIVAVVALDVAAYILVPPFPKDGQPGQQCAFPACFIEGNMEVPAPHVIVGAPAPTDRMFYFEPSLSSTLLTMWLLMALILFVFVLGTRRMRIVPGRVQNAIEWAYESLENFALNVGGAAAKPYVPVFAGFFIFILVSNWAGLVPPIGKVSFLRAPTSDLNVTIGLALTAFVFFESQGIRHLGVRGYLGKFFPLGEFRHGIGTGLMAMFVGLIELFLELVKPVTLSMRLFGNIFGGEVALGVLTGLTIAIFPVLMYSLELVLNLIQALLFSILTLMFTLLAVEGHSSGDHEASPSIETEGAASRPHREMSSEAA
jgi:F-type H+-transporting ATPase subunit a